MFKSKFCTRDDSAFNEATAHPIFLFQRKVWNLIAVPDDYEIGDEGEVYNTREAKLYWKAFEEWDGSEDDEEPKFPEALSWEQLAETSQGDYDTPCAIYHWETVCVFLTREEAEQFGKAQHYNYRDGWRVYSVCTQGELRHALDDGTEKNSK